MTPAASPPDRPPPPPPPMMVPAAAALLPLAEIAAKDGIIAWYRGEFAAANAIIDALCNHLTQLNSIHSWSPNSLPSEYDSVFAAIHRRRLNWIPVLQMQKYFSIADVAVELRKVAAAKRSGKESTVVGEEEEEEEEEKEKEKRDFVIHDERNRENICDSDFERGEDVDRGRVIKLEEEQHLGDGTEEIIAEKGTQEVEDTPELVDICDDHEDCGARREQIKMTKGFVAKEPVKGHMVNVVKGLKLYEDAFTTSELLKLKNLANELRIAGQNGELPGETYVLFNKQIKGNKREQIQLGVPVFEQTIDEAADGQQRSDIEPIPALLQSVIDHLVQWQIIPENRKPNGCIISYFDEEEYSQPYLKPPHLDQPLCTLLLSESTIAFGRALVSDHDGNYKGQLTLYVKEGSIIVSRNKSADMARHAMCPSPTRRVSIIFFRVRPDTDHNRPRTLAPLTQPMTLWQHQSPSSPAVPVILPNGNDVMNVTPKWGIIRSPMVMLTPLSPVTANPRRLAHGGTGVFLPWALGSRNHVRHLPPRAQKRRLLALPSIETHVSDTMSDPGMEGTKVM